MIRKLQALKYGQAVSSLRQKTMPKMGTQRWAESLFCSLSGSVLYCGLIYPIHMPDRAWCNGGVRCGGLGR